MRFLVTGAAGFIGKHIMKRLQKENCIGIDNLNCSNTINGDIRDFEFCKHITRGVDVIFHQAAISSVPRSFLDPKETFEVNVMGFLNVILSSIENGVSKIIYASSSAVYENDGGIKNEESNLSPLSPYGLSKKINEEQALLFSNKIDMVGLRYFNVFGEGASQDSVIPSFIKNLKTLKGITINGDASISRDFVHVNDVVDMNMLAVLSRKKGHNIYNVASGRSVSLSYVAKVIASSLFLDDFKVDIVQRRVGDIQSSSADIKKARKELSYIPKVSFEEGISQLVRN